MKYKKKPAIIDAIHFNGENIQEVLDFASSENVVYSKELGGIVIHTLEGDMLARPDYYIVQGVRSEFYPCRPDIFEQTYEPVEE